MEGADYIAHKASVKQEGLLDAITLFEGKVLDGRNRERACEETKTEPRYEELPAGTNPYSFVIAKNLHRRHLNEAQRAFIAAELSNMQRGGDKKSRKYQSANRPIDFIDQPAAAEEMQVSERQVRRAKKVKAKGIPELRQAVEKEEVSLGVAEHIATVVPPEQQEQAIAQAKLIARKKSKAVPKVSKPKQPKKSESKPREPKPQWTPEQAARDKACLEIVNAPSTYPHDAVISQNPSVHEAGLRLAIEWLREHEGQIATFNRKMCDEMLLRTNRLQGYHLNYHNFPRPDGDIDPKLLDWAQNLWVRRVRQQERLELAAMLRPPRRRKPESKEARSFEDRFKTFWMMVEDSLSLFRRGECSQLIKASRDEVKQFFSISGENRGAAEVA